MRRASDQSQLLLLARPARPLSVVEGGFAEGQSTRDEIELLEGRLEAIAKSKRTKRQVLGATRYALKRGIQSRCSWLAKSIRHCGAKRPGRSVEIARSTSGHPVWLGVNRCGDPRACPTCAAAVTAQRRDELLEGFDRAREFGWSALAVTLTLRHGLGNDAGKLAQLLSTAYRMTFSRSRMRKLLKRLDDQGAVRIVEVNHNFDNGYHPHLHVVFFFGRALEGHEVDEMRSSLFLAWVRAVADAQLKVGVDCGLPSLEHGVDVQHLDLARGPEYFVKVGLVAELLGQWTKEGRAARSRTMWEVARDMVLNDRVGLSERAAEDEAIWHGYVSAMRHFKSYFVATRLRRSLLAPLQLELELEDSGPGAVVLHTFSDQEYALVQRAGPLAFAAIDELVEDGKAGADIAAYLARLAEHLENLDDRRAGRAPVPFAVTEGLGVATHSFDDPQSLYGADRLSINPRTRAMVIAQDVLETFDRLLAAA